MVREKIMFRGDAEMGVVGKNAPGHRKELRPCPKEHSGSKNVLKHSKIGTLADKVV